MYAYIKGTFVSARGDNIVIENNGIGYKIYMPLMLQGRIGHIGDEVCVYLLISKNELFVFTFF